MGKHFRATERDPERKLFFRQFYSLPKMVFHGRTLKKTFHWRPYYRFQKTVQLTTVVFFGIFIMAAQIFGHLTWRKSHICVEMTFQVNMVPFREKKKGKQMLAWKFQLTQRRLTGLQESKSGIFSFVVFDDIALRWANFCNELSPQHWRDDNNHYALKKWEKGERKQFKMSFFSIFGLPRWLCWQRKKLILWKFYISSPHVDHAAALSRLKLRRQHERSCDFNIQCLTFITLTF